MSLFRKEAVLVFLLPLSIILIGLIAVFVLKALK
jgi:hypothetical protein